MLDRGTLRESYRDFWTAWHNLKHFWPSSTILSQAIMTLYLHINFWGGSYNINKIFHKSNKTASLSSAQYKEGNRKRWLYPPYSPGNRLIQNPNSTQRLYNLKTKRTLSVHLSLSLTLQLIPPKFGGLFY